MTAFLYQRSLITRSSCSSPCLTSASAMARTLVNRRHFRLSDRARDRTPRQREASTHEPGTGCRTPAMNSQGAGLGVAHRCRDYLSEGGSRSRSSLFEREVKTQLMARLDPHSYTDSDQPETASFDWQVLVDFERRRLVGRAELRLAASAARERGGPFDLDTRELHIESVEADGRPLVFELGAPDPILGSRLRITLPPGTAALCLRYHTSEQATALGWLSPEQTAGKRQPYLFSQCQAIHARSIVPLQDTPRRRVVFTARLDVPGELRSLMAARFVERHVEAS